MRSTRTNPASGVVCFLTTCLLLGAPASARAQDTAVGTGAGQIARQQQDKATQAAPYNPIVTPALDGSGVLTFGNAAVRAGFARAPTGCKAIWYTFDNTTGEASRVSETENPTGRMQAPPAALRATPGAFVKVQLSATSTGASVMGEARGRVLPATGQRLDARRPRAAAGRTVSRT